MEAGRAAASDTAQTEGVSPADGRTVDHPPANDTPKDVSVAEAGGGEEGAGGGGGGGGAAADGKEVLAGGGEGGGVEKGEGEGGGGGEVKLSKNQQKKLAKQARIKEKRIREKEEKKEKKRKAREEREAEGGGKGENRLPRPLLEGERRPEDKRKRQKTKEEFDELMSKGQKVTQTLHPTPLFLVIHNQSSCADRFCSGTKSSTLDPGPWTRKFSCA